MKQRCFFISILSLFSILLSCTNEDFCAMPMTSLVNAGFYNLQGDEVTAISIYKFWARGSDLDSLINTDTTDVKGLQLPLSNSEDSCNFIFSFKVLDTIITIDTIPDKLSKYSLNNYLNISDTIVSDTQVVEVDLTDTLQLFYSRELLYISPACGFMYNYNLLNIFFTRHYIDTIMIINPYISASNEEKNIQILF